MKKNWRGKLTVDKIQLTRNAFRLNLSIALCQLSILVAMVLLVACNQKNTTHEDDQYTCPMHPTVITDRPGNCPVCGMDLVRKAQAGEEVEMTEELARLIKSPNESVVSSIKTIKGEFTSQPVTVDAQGIVAYDTKNTYTISSRVSGRLEKVFLKYIFQPVTKGQKIAEVYSPELITAERELIFVMENDPGNQSLMDAARSKLHLLGLSESHIDKLVKNKVAGATYTIYSPHTGYIIADQAIPVNSTPTGGEMSNGMNTSETKTKPMLTSVEGSSTSLIREGSYVAAGQILFRVVNTDALRIELNLPADGSSSLKKGNQLALDFGNGITENAVVDFVQPFFDEGQDFVKIRAYTKNTGLHIGHLVNTKITVASVEALWVPKEAVIDLGVDKIVFLKDRGALKPKKVAVGTRSNGLVEIKSGLSSSDEIASNAQYLVDSESFIKTAN